MSDIHFRRLDPSVSADLLDWQSVFREAPSFVYATDGRSPTDADAERIMRTLPKGGVQEDVFALAIERDGALCGCAFVMKGYPKPEIAYLALLVLMERFQGCYLGVRCLRQIEALALSWNCTSLEGVVDSENARAAALWERLGFRELYRRKLPWLVGPAIVGAKDLSSNKSVNADAQSRSAAAPRRSLVAGYVRR
jgi:ribosomal protein S18 acetylase RimI-like enzyme